MSKENLEQGGTEREAKADRAAAADETRVEATTESGQTLAQ